MSNRYLNKLMLSFVIVAGIGAIFAFRGGDLGSSGRSGDLHSFVAETPTPTPFAAPPGIPAGSQQATILSAQDGGRVTVDFGWARTSVDLLGFEMPAVGSTTEAKECYADEALAWYLEQLQPGKLVYLQPDQTDTDSQNRLVRWLWLTGEDGAEPVLFNAEIVRTGNAKAKSEAPNIVNDAAIVKAEKSASHNKRGLWGACKKDSGNDDATPETNSTSVPKVFDESALKRSVALTPFNFENQPAQFRWATQIWNGEADSSLEMHGPLTDVRVSVLADEDAAREMLKEYKGASGKSVTNQEYPDFPAVWSVSADGSTITTAMAVRNLIVVVVADVDSFKRMNISEPESWALQATSVVVDYLSRSYSE